MSTLLTRAAEAAFLNHPGFHWRRFHRWTPKLVAAFRKVESEAFREELRYSRMEMRSRSHETGFEGLTVWHHHQPIAVVIIRSGMVPKSLYLDTLAVVETGGGIGGRLLRSILEEAEIDGYGQVDLDTEQVSERGIPLVDWYRRHGFRVVETDKSSGNVSMRRILPKAVEPDDDSGDMVHENRSVSAFSPRRSTTMPIHRAQ